MLIWVNASIKHTRKWLVEVWVHNEEVIFLFFPKFYHFFFSYLKIYKLSNFFNTALMMTTGSIWKSQKSEILGDKGVTSYPIFTSRCPIKSKIYTQLCLWWLYNTARLKMGNSEEQRGQAEPMVNTIKYNTKLGNYI